MHVKVCPRARGKWGLIETCMHVCIDLKKKQVGGSITCPQTAAWHLHGGENDPLWHQSDASPWQLPRWRGRGNYSFPMCRRVCFCTLPKATQSSNPPNHLRLWKRETQQVAMSHRNQIWSCSLLLMHLCFYLLDVYLYCMLHACADFNPMWILISGFFS